MQLFTPSKIHEPSGKTPFHLQTFSLYLPLSPICQNYPLQGLCAEHLSPLILTYYPPFRGVILSYSNARLSEAPQGYTGDEEHGKVLAKSVAEYAASFVWITAEFLIFKPKKGGYIEGWINLQNESHLGLVCWNLFNASIEKQRLPKSWRWVPAGVDSRAKSTARLKNSQDDPSSEGEQNDTSTSKVNRAQEDEGYLRFRVKDVDTSLSTDKEKSFLSIEGTLLSEGEEKALLNRELRMVDDGDDGMMAGRGVSDHSMLGA